MYLPSKGADKPISASSQTLMIRILLEMVFGLKYQFYSETMGGV